LLSTSRLKQTSNALEIEALEQETVSGSGISWAICKSAPQPWLITMSASHHSVVCRPDAFPAPNQPIFVIYLPGALKVLPFSIRTSLIWGYGSDAKWGKCL